MQFDASYYKWLHVRNVLLTLFLLALLTVFFLAGGLFVARERKRDL
jgi:hypothetical protein